MSSKMMSPTVRVPVLSRQTVSTRARPSTAGSSCTNTCCRVSCTAASRKATDVSSTKPSGTSPTSPPVDRITTSRQPWSPTTLACEMICKGSATMITQVMYLSSLLTDSWISLRALVNLRASAAILLA